MHLTISTKIRVTLCNDEIPFRSIDISCTVSAPITATINVPYFNNIMKMPACCPIVVSVMHKGEWYVVFSGRVMGWAIDRSGPTLSLQLLAGSWSAALSQHSVYCGGAGPITYAPVVNGSNIIEGVAEGSVLSALSVMLEGIKDWENSTENVTYDQSVVLLHKVKDLVYDLATQYNNKGETKQYGHGYLGHVPENIGAPLINLLAAVNVWAPPYLNLKWLTQLLIYKGLEGIAPGQRGSNLTFDYLLRSILTMVSYTITESAFPYLNMCANYYSLSSISFTPKLLWGPVPKCNVINPNVIQSMSLSRNYLSEPTRVVVDDFGIPQLPIGIVHTADTVLPSAAKDYTVTKEKDFNEITKLMDATRDELPGKGVVLKRGGYLEDYAYLTITLMRDTIFKEASNDPSLEGDMLKNIMDGESKAPGSIMLSAAAFAKYLYDVGKLNIKANLTTIGPAAYLVGAPILVPSETLPIVGIVLGHSISITSSGAWTNNVTIEYVRATFDDKSLPEILDFSGQTVFTSAMFGELADPLSMIPMSDASMLKAGRRLVDIMPANRAEIGLTYRKNMTKADAFIASKEYKYFASANFKPDLSMWDREIKHD